jgi:hypothetical protein
MRNFYPSYPPVVKVIRPRLSDKKTRQRAKDDYIDCIGMLSRITSFPALQLSHWSPVYGLEKVLGQIRFVLERDGRLEVPWFMNDRKM